MKVLFLDIDGVLATWQAQVFNERNHPAMSRKLYTSFCPIATSSLLTVLEDVPDLKIVVSSTWRLNMDRVKEAFETSGIPWDRVVGRTPTSRGIRGDQIKQWLDEHPEVTQYAIVDDDTDMLPEQLPNFVRTNTMTGLNCFGATRLVLIFNPNYDHGRLLDFERE